MSELQLKTPSNKLIGGKISFTPGVKRPSMLSAFALAGLVTGVNWFIQSRLAAAEKARQEQVIGRIASDKTVELNDLRNFQELDQYEGCKVKIRGELEISRFVVKRKKNNEDGYLVLAPFIVGKIVSNNDLTKSTLNQKFMLNLGWVPKQNKYRIRETLSPFVAGEVEVAEETQVQENPLFFSNVTAYVRKGEKRDFLRGYRNWAQSQLFKFIDLDFLSDRYCNLYPSFKYIYLDRIEESENLMSFPEGNTKSEYIQHVRDQIDYNNKVRNYFSWGVGVTSFCAAVLLTI